MALEQLSLWLLNLVDWGRGIVVFLIIMELFKAARSNDTVSDAAGKAGKWAWARTPFTKAKAKRVIKKEMNEYITEAEQEKNLDEVRDLGRIIVADLEILKKGQANSKKTQDVVKKIKKLGENISAARNYFNGSKYFGGLNRKTTRAQTGINNLLEYMKKRGLRDAEMMEKVRFFEDNILKLHQQTAEELGKVEAFYAELMNLKFMEQLENGSLVTQPSEEAFDRLIKGFRDLDAALEDAYKRQTEARQEVVALISLTRNLV